MWEKKLGPPREGGGGEVEDSLPEHRRFSLLKGLFHGS